MNYSVVDKKFKEMEVLFSGWHNSIDIIDNKKSIFKRVLKIFNNKKKIDAIFEFICFLEKEGIEKFKTNLVLNGIEYVINLSFFGPATSRHFLKNLEISIAKPDRYLERISYKFGFDNTNSFCEYLSDGIDEDIRVIDLVFWRYANLNRDYIYQLDKYLAKTNYALSIN